MRLALALVYLQCICLLSVGAVQAHPASLNYLVISGLSSPFQLVKDDESSGGIISDIVAELASRTGRDLQILIASNERIDQVIGSSLNQPWITYSAKVWRRLEDHLHYLEVPLFDVSHSLLTCAPDLNNISSVEELKDKKLAILKSFDYPELKPPANAGKVQLVDVRNYKQAYQLVKHGRVDGFVEMDIRIKYNLDEASHDGCMRFVDLSSLIPTYPIYLAVNKGLDETTISALEQALRAMRTDGTIPEILKRYETK